MLTTVVLGGRVPRAARRIGLALAFLAVTYGVGATLGAFDGMLNETVGRVLYDTVIVGAALLLAARPLLVPDQRIAWSLIAGGLALWATGDVWYTVVADGTGRYAYPSMADVFFVACYALFTAGAVALARQNLRANAGLVLLDGLTAALATTSLALALLWGPATDLVEQGESAYAPALAYPVSDSLVLAFAIGMLAMSGAAWRRTWLLLAAGWAITGAADTIHVYDAVDGGYVFGSAYDFLWPLSAVCIAAAGWQAAGTVTIKPIQSGAMFAFPSLFALPALGVLVIDHFARVGIVPLLLATATIVLVFVRVAIALSELARAHDAQLRMRERDAQSRRLESLGQLAGGVAHDFNNLLAVILNYAHVLTASLPEGDERRGDAEEISRTAERAGTLARQLLLFSRRDMSWPELVDVGSSLAAMAPMLRSTVSERIQLRVIAADNVAQVRLGAGQLDQIVLNLAVNARDAMPKGGQLTVVAEDVTADALPPDLQLPAGRYVRLTVRDTGTGMSEQVRERAFEPFFSTKSVGHGTGLGLATVYGIIEHAGGAIDIRSREGAGTSVLVYLPAAVDCEEEADATPDRGLPRGNGERILLVEDESGVRRSSARILRDNGYRVLEARNGEDALARAAREWRRIDLLVTDVVMPELSGGELARRLDADGRDIPVIFLSGHPTWLVGDEGPREGDGSMLLKPVRAAALLQAVRAALDERAATDREQGAWA